jgi:hypothetical protein
VNAPPGPLLTVDVAHPPRHPSVVEEDLAAAIARVRRSNALRVLKIIHGYGSTGRGGSTREAVLNWLYRQRTRVNAIVEGPAYGILDPATAEMRRSVGPYPDPDLGRQNAGITIVWVK